MGNSQTLTLNIKALFDASDVAKGAQQIQNVFKNIKVSNTLQSDFQKAFSNLENSVNKVQQKYQQGFKTKGDVSSFEKSFKEMENAATQYEKVIQRIQTEVGTSVDLSKLIKWDDSTLAKLKEVEQNINKIKASLQFNIKDGPFSKIEQALSKISKTAPKTTEIINNFKKALSDGDLAEAEAQLTKLENIWSRFKGKESYNAIFGEEGLKKAFDELKNSGIFEQLEELYNSKGQIQTAGWEKIISIFEKAGIDVRALNGELGKTKGQLSGAASAQQAWNSSVDQFKSRIQYFFGLNNVIQLIRRSLREALNTVKELDAAMAQTAVVTNFTIADMWDQLPRYTEVANQLGVTTKGAYETMTLFYQQGLDTNQTFAIGTETMKMARIAGIDYATATDYMTAALRGFNMELNELSAQRVNDVYSRLAAITASNTQEISTAMTKVASLAHNANMEFETTSAFLAQIIETTRESAETAGTALKTVVARFSEVKKMINTNQLTGTDSEGEVIDVNRVSAALRTAGIDMNKYFLGEVGLDDIFMELASKWDSLTSVQQRYIATQAAGSRQQSRFIAMMSNYARTQQLVQEAYNSNGASAKQFEKTQASLETALNRLNNAWDQFTMNLANNDAIKTAVNALTELLNAINKVTGAFGSGWRTILTGGLTIGALLGGGRLTNAAFSASKIARANANMTWGHAFKTQLGHNPYTYDLSSGAVNGQARRDGFLRSYFAPKNLEQYNLTPELYQELSTHSSRAESFTSMSPEAQAHYYDYLNYKKGPLQSKKVGAGVAAAGLAFSAAGSVITQNSEAIAEKLNKSSKSVEDFGSKMSTLGNTASLAGTMFMLLPPGINAVAAALVGLVGIASAFRGETFGEKLERLGEETQEAEQAATSAQKAYDDLLSGASTHEELLDKISRLKEGTLEFRKAVLEANQAAQQLIDNYGLSSEDYIRDNNGLIHFNPGVIEKLQEEQMKAAENAEKRANVAQLNEESVRTAGSKYDTFTKAMSDIAVYDTGDWETTQESLKTAREVIEAEKPSEEALLQGQKTFQSTLYSLMGSNLNDATRLAIENLTSNYNPDEIASDNERIAREVNKLTDDNLRQAFEDEIGTIPQDLDIDGLRKQLILQRQASELQTKVTAEATRASQRASKDALKYTKKTMQEALALSGSGNTYDLLAARSAQSILAKTQRQVSEYTNLPLNLRYGNFSVEDTQQIGNIAENFGITFGKETATAVIAEINNSLLNGDNSLLNSLSSINFGTALSSNLKQLRDAIGTTGNDSAKIFETAFQEVGGEAGIFQSLYYNQTELINGFNELADSAGTIPASAILDAVDSCDELADALDICDINAAGLAAALTEINLDNLEADQVTSGLLKAFSAAEDIVQILAEADKFLNDWEEAPSGDRFAKWASGGAKSIIDAFSAGRYQDEQARQYMQAMLGDNFMQSYNQIMSNVGNIASNQGPDAALAYINQNLGRELQLFNDLTEADNLQPLYQYFEEQGKIIADGAVTFKDGMVLFDDTIVHTAEEARQKLIDSGINETLADIMIGDYLENSPDALVKWSKNAAEKGLNTFRDELKSGGTVLQGELDTFFEKYRQYFENDADWNDWKNQFENEIKQYDGQVINLKVDWATGEDPIGSLRDALEKTGGLEKYLENADVFKLRKTGLTGNINHDTLLDLDNLKQAFQDLGATEAQAMTIAQQYADETGASFRAAYDEWNFVQGETADDPGHWEKSTQYVEGYTSAVEAAAAAQQKTSQELSEMESKIRQADIAAGVTDAIKTLAGEGTKIDIPVLANAEQFNSTVNQVKQSKTDLENPVETKLNVKDEITPAAQGAKAALNDIPSEKHTHLYIHEHTIKESDAKGGIVGSYASGSASNKLHPGMALTGEEGPEIVWNKNQGYAYITGEKHPEFQNLQPGDRVFNAQETKKILQGAATGGKVSAYAAGYLPGVGKDKKDSPGGGNNSGSNSKNKDKTSEEWKNELDWLYNLMEDIVELERDQKALEEDYEDALKDQTKTGRDLYNLLIKQLGNLYTQLDHQTFALQKREQEMREFMDTTNDQDKYLWYNWQDRTLEIDWDAIDQIKDEELYKHVKDLIDEAEEIQGKMDDAEDAITDINNQIQELENIWRDTFTDFEKRVYDAIVKQYQTVIDNYSELNDTLNNSNSQILDSLQKQISLERQIRDNTKTEEEITDDEARLAYLRRDTSGGNDLAALQLEKELSEQRQNYEDTLVDQAISRLQEDNDAAAQQRQQQIDIMQAQLDYQSQNGEFNAAVRELLEGAISDDGHLATDSDLYRLLVESENADAMSKIGREVWDEELNGTFKEVVAFLLKQNAEENGTFYTALTAAVKTVSTAIGSYSQAMTKMGSEVAKAASGGRGGGGGSSSHNRGGYTSKENNGSNNQLAGSEGHDYINAFSKQTKTTSNSLNYAAARAEQILLKKSGRAGGGLVSQTGIAMLHGTVDEPEYVLNARQTDAFLKLADVLPSMMGSNANTQNNTFGSTYVNLSVNLDSVNPDYDVDRMVDLLKDKLYDAGSYRNVNSLSFIR